MQGEDAQNGRIGQIRSATKNYDKFLEQERLIHSDLYDYNHKTYKNSKTPIEIICKKHGSFKQTPDSHINGKHGCPDCGDEEISERLKQITKNFKIDLMINHQKIIPLLNLILKNTKE